MSGKPVLSTPAGGAAETFEPGVTGLVIDDPAPAAIAAQMASLLADEAFARRAAQRGPAFVEARFGLTRMIDETLALYGLEVVSRRIA